MKKGVIYRAYYADKSYIGRTIDFESRRLNHFSYANRGLDYAFHRALRKHGFHNFNWEILESDIPDSEIVECEIYWIKKYDSYRNGYNMSGGGEGLGSGDNNPFYGRNHTDETKKKMSESKSGKYDGEGNPMYGKKQSEETKRKISESLKNRKLSKKTREKMSNAQKGNKKFLGKKHSAETKRKISESKRKK